MTDADRYKLLGTYRTPRVRVGRVLACEARDCDLVVVEMSDARIPWPVGRRRGQSGKSLAVFGDLARAVRTESNQAVCYWFGVTPQTVSKWRKALGVGLTNAGTHRLRSDYQQEPWAVTARGKAQAKARDPQRRRKIADAKRGKPRPTPPGWVPNGIAWTAEADQLVRTLPPKLAAERTGHPVESVYQRRLKLGVANNNKAGRVSRLSGPSRPGAGPGAPHGRKGTAPTRQREVKG
jgi:hypothetical protein